jgi:RNA polymerase sigma-70 factor (subfamily 1)
MTPDSTPGPLTARLEAHRQQLYAFVRLHAPALLKARESPSDLVQSIFAEFLRKRDDFGDLDESQLRCWLMKAAQNMIAAHHRFWRREKRDAARERPVSGLEISRANAAKLLRSYSSFCTPSQHAIQKEEVARIESCFAKLSEEHRLVITLSRIGGLSHAEVGSQLGRSEDAARMLLNRALVALSKILTDSKAGPRRDESQ